MLSQKKGNAITIWKAILEKTRILLHDFFFHFGDTNIIFANCNENKEKFDFINAISIDFLSWNCVLDFGKFIDKYTYRSINR